MSSPIAPRASHRWDTARRSRQARLARARAVSAERWVDPSHVTALLEAIIEPGDRVCLEGDNQKQADFLARCLAAADPARLHDLHLVLSVLALPEHIELFERGLARRVDFSFSGPQAVRLAQLVAAGKIEIGAIHTYLELYARYFVDLTPRVALVTAVAADGAGNLYTGPNTEDTPAIVEATAFKGWWWRRWTAAWSGCPGSTSPPAGWTSSPSRPPRAPSSRCSRATRRRSPRSRC